MRIVCLRILAFGALLLLAAGAQAGAWLEPPGQGEVIFGGSFSDSLRAFDVRGRLAPVSSYKKFAALGSKLTLEGMVNGYRWPHTFRHGRLYARHFWADPSPGRA
jgi:hypothetical protein